MQGVTYNKLERYMLNTKFVSCHKVLRVTLIIL